MLGLGDRAGDEGGRRHAQRHEAAVIEYDLFGTSFAFLSRDSQSITVYSNGRLGDSTAYHTHHPYFALYVIERKAVRLYAAVCMY